LAGDAASPASRPVARHEAPPSVPTVAPPQSVTQILRSVQDHSDRGAWLTAIARVVKQQTGGDVLIATAAAPAADSQAAEDVPEPTSGSTARAVPAGDLNGDGMGDSLVRKHHYGGAVMVQARSGADGSLLWKRPDAGDRLFIPAFEDLTGDATEDIVEVRLRMLSERDACRECVEGRYSATFRWVVGVLSGARGSRAWTRRYSGDLVESWEYGCCSSWASYQRSNYTLRGRNIDVVPFITSRRGGGRPELVLNAWDAEYHWHATTTYAGAWPIASADRYSYDYALRAKTRARLIATRDGRVVRTLREHSTGMLALLYPLTDRGGRDNLMWERVLLPDSSADCVTVSSPLSTRQCLDERERRSLQVVLLDGRTLRQRWTRSLALSSDVFDWQSLPSGADFNADGRDDLQIVKRDWDGFKTTYVSSATGRKLWHAAGFPVAAGPMDGKRGADVLNLIEAESDSGTVYTLTLERRNGRSGAVAGSRRWRVKTNRSDDDGNTTHSWFHVSAGGDVNGDRAPDYAVSLLHWQETYEGHERVEHPLRSRSHVFSGADGTSLYTLDVPRVVSLDVDADFDGDGIAEVARTTYHHTHGPYGSQTFAPLRLADRRTLWRFSAQGTSSHWDPVLFAVSGDDDGARGADVMLHVDTVDDQRRQATTLTSLAGRTGAARWSVKLGS
jgi:hypothetical protein